MKLWEFVCCRYVELGRLGVLQVENVTASDGGMYRCRASNDARERLSNDARLTVIAGSTAIGLFTRRFT